MQSTEILLKSAAVLFAVVGKPTNEAVSQLAS